tara:strand:- start:516 stop:899 length:384 start_codon:yes stop_codon:yes gene_type:complete
MKNKFVAQQYKTTEQLRTVSPDNANTVLLKCFDELLNSIKTFQQNIVPDIANIRKKSISFSRALTIIYTLQSSIDFEKNLSVAKSLFQIYEFTRLALISEFKACKIDKSLSAVQALTEIRDSWRLID